MGFFVGGETGEDEVGVAELLSSGGVGAEAEAGELVGTEVFDDGFQAIVAAGGAGGAEANGAEGEGEIVAGDESLFEGDFVEVDDLADGATDFVVETGGFDEEGVAYFGDLSVEFFVGLPGEAQGFGVEVEGEEAEVVAGEVVLRAGVAEGEDEVFHGDIVA